MTSLPRRRVSGWACQSQYRPKPVRLSEPPHPPQPQPTRRACSHLALGAGEGWVDLYGALQPVVDSVTEARQQIAAPAALAPTEPQDGGAAQPGLPVPAPAHSSACVASALGAALKEKETTALKVAIVGLPNVVRAGSLRCLPALEMCSEGLARLGRGRRESLRWPIVCWGAGAG